jgi:serine/threonine protein kinase
VFSDRASSNAYHIVRTKSELGCLTYFHLSSWNRATGQFGEVFLANYEKKFADVAPDDPALNGVEPDEKGNVELQVAVKTMMSKVTPAGEKEFNHEAVLQLKLEHPNITKVLGVCFKEKLHMVVLELILYGDLKKVTETCNDNSIAVEPVTHLHCLQQVCSGMAYITSKNIVHLDLAARNCLVGAKTAIKLADFGLSREYTKDLPGWKLKGKAKIPFKWCPPETLPEKLWDKSITGYSPIFNEKSDMWATGIICWELATKGRVPFEGKKLVAMLQKVAQDGLRVEWPEDGDEELQAFHLRCCATDPADRPTFATLDEELQARVNSQLDSVQDLGLLLNSKRGARLNEASVMVTEAKRAHWTVMKAALKFKGLLRRPGGLKSATPGFIAPAAWVEDESVPVHASQQDADEVVEDGAVPAWRLQQIEDMQEEKRGYHDSKSREDKRFRQREERAEKKRLAIEKALADGTEMDEFNKAEEHHAASLIQAQFRGFKVRKQVKADEDKASRIDGMRVANEKFRVEAEERHKRSAEARAKQEAAAQAQRAKTKRASVTLDNAEGLMDAFHAAPTRPVLYDEDSWMVGKSGEIERQQAQKAKKEEVRVPVHGSYQRGALFKPDLFNRFHAFHDDSSDEEADHNDTDGTQWTRVTGVAKSAGSPKKQSGAAKMFMGAKAIANRLAQSTLPRRSAGSKAAAIAAEVAAAKAGQTKSSKKKVGFAAGGVADAPDARGRGAPSLSADVHSFSHDYEEADNSWSSFHAANTDRPEQPWYSAHGGINTYGKFPKQFTFRFQVHSLDMKGKPDPDPYMVFTRTPSAPIIASTTRRSGKPVQLYKSETLKSKDDPVFKPVPFTPNKFSGNRHTIDAPVKVAVWDTGGFLVSDQLIGEATISLEEILSGYNPHGAKPTLPMSWPLHNIQREGDSFAGTIVLLRYDVDEVDVDSKERPPFSGAESMY